MHFVNNFHPVITGHCDFVELQYKYKRKRHDNNSGNNNMYRHYVSIHNKGLCKN